jgi:hypothetical protein
MRILEVYLLYIFTKAKLISGNKFNGERNYFKVWAYSKLIFSQYLDSSLPL